MYKISLAEIKAGGSLHISKFDSESHGLSYLNFQATHGATQTMYWASHNITTQFKLFSWPEDSNDVVHQAINLSPAWYKNFPTCPGPDGRDWCGRAYDGRMMTGWLSNGIIGFMWSSSQGGNFPYPYIEVVRINEKTKTLMDRPIIWSSNTAFAFPAVYPNARGDLGFSMFMGGGNYYPTGLVGFNQGLTISQTITTTWELTAIASSTQGPDVNEWGDYVSVRPFSPLNRAWVATSYNLMAVAMNLV